MINNEKIEELFKNPKYFGNLENAKYKSKAIDVKNKDILYLEINEENEKILDVRYKVFNKSIIFAICEIISENMINNNIYDALYMIEEKLIEDIIGEIDSSYLYELDLYKNALKEIIIQLENDRIENLKKLEENTPQIKRLLNLTDENDFSNLSNEQVKKILQSMDELNTVKSEQEKNKIIDKIKFINSSKKTSQPSPNINQKAIELLKDEVPDFSSYKDNTVSLNFDTYIKNKSEGNEDSHLTFDFSEEDEVLNFSSYKFDDNDKW